MYLLIIIVAAALSISFICSILEAAFLSANIPGLIERKKKNRGAALLLNLKQKRLDDAISAILTLNTISNTIGAALAGAQVAALYGSRWVAYFSIALTIMIFIFSEIIPKTLGTVHAMRLSGVVGRLTYFLTLVMSPILVVTRVLTKLIARNKKIEVTRGEISAMVTMAANQGAISDEQSKVLANLLHYDRLNVVDVMTPRPVLAVMHVDTTITNLLEAAHIKAFSRIPLYEQNQDDVKGYIVVREVLAWALRNPGKDRRLGTFIRPISMMPKSFSVGDALRVLTENSEHLAIVLDEYGGVSGLVTLEDLLETVLGVEIIDELDHVVDLRTTALKIRDQRLARIREKSGENAQAANQD